MVSSTDAQSELLISLVRDPAGDPGAADRVTALTRAIDAAALLTALHARRLTAVLGVRLGELSRGDLPPPLPTAIAEALARGRAGAIAQLAQIQQLAGAFDRAGIRMLPVKGPGLAEAAHGDIGMRVSSDLDLLVAPEDMGAAAKLLGDLGYASKGEDKVLDSGLPELHLAFAAPGRTPIDLHWRVHWHAPEFSRELLDTAKPGPDGALALESTQLAAALLAFYARDGFSGLRLATDAAGLVRRAGFTSTGGVLDAHVQRYPALAPSWRAAALALERIAAIPAGTWLTGAARDAGRRERIAVRLANPLGTGNVVQQGANLVLVDALLSPVGDARNFAGRLLNGSPDDRLARHVVKMAGRMGLGLLQARRQPRAVR